MNLYNLIKLAALIATVAGALFASPSGLSPDKAGATEILGEETDLGNGVVVQAYGFLEPDGRSTWPRNVRVVRDGCVIYDRPLCSGAEYYKIEDLNGNGSLDFRYGYGSQGTGNVEYSEIIDPLFHTMFRLDCETFKDLDGDGSLEAIARDHGIAYRWNYGVDEIDVRVVRKWSPSGEYWLPLGWEIDQEACYKPPPTEEGFQNLIREMRSCLSTLHPSVINTWADDMYDSNGSYLGCIAPKMVELCYTGHPNLAFTLLDESWPGTTKDKVSFEQEFIEELRNAEYVEVTTKFGLFDIAGRRRLQQEETLGADANFRDGDGDTPLPLSKRNTTQLKGCP